MDDWLVQETVTASSVDPAQPIDFSILPDSCTLPDVCTPGGPTPTEAELSDLPSFGGVRGGLSAIGVPDLDDLP